MSEEDSVFEYIWYEENKDDILDQVNKFESITREIERAGFPSVESPDKAEELVNLFYYTAQFAIYYVMRNGDVKNGNVLELSEDEMREKAYFTQYLDKYQRIFKFVIRDIGDSVYNLVCDKLENYLGTEDHVMVFFLNAMEKHKEMHSRRVKTDPGGSRTRDDEILETVNAVTGERYNSMNPDHKVWRMLILNPLPSDEDFNAIDPAEGGREHALAIEVEKQQGTYTIDDPFAIVVTPEWDKLLRAVHSILHMEEYLINYIVGAITDEEWKDIDDGMGWFEAWEYLVGSDFSTVPIQKFSREKKKVPLVVSRMAELRDFLKEMLYIK